MHLVALAQSNGQDKRAESRCKAGSTDRLSKPLLYCEMRKALALALPLAQAFQPGVTFPHHATKIPCVEIF